MNDDMLEIIKLAYSNSPLDGEYYIRRHLASLYRDVNTARLAASDAEKSGNSSLSRRLEFEAVRAEIDITDIENTVSDLRSMSK